jgi:hypothetical protein
MPGSFGATRPASLLHQGGLANEHYYSHHDALSVSDDPAGNVLSASGSDIAVVSKLLGHSSISVTADIYAHMKGVGQRTVDGAATLIPRKSAHTLHSQEGVNT